MKDYFLRANSRKIIDEALQSAGLLSYIDGESVTPHDVAIDYVGTIYRPTGHMLLDTEGEEYPEIKPVEGYHANLRADLTAEQEALLPIIEAPNQPQRIFAGGIL
ncbi:hypothetical protein GGR41_000584 [Paenalcaligenes hominis]|uniref:Uncharacterized protein n=1 Tax=Paenalcaligenes hominis TaxID=643674 RepID=A0ABX0WM99_9BURK|nr:hypothetical protein [Paenalcaligenes hominis]NJB64363.1 hypothetical protein [Paenalcaligenes hominis]GGE68202.1 hypothetical protein GCM10007278_15380 [Paenalcaligenes hominis]